MKLKTAVGTTLVLAGLAMAGGAGWSLYSAYATEGLVRRSFDKADAECLVSFRKLGKVQVANGRWLLSRQVDGDPRRFMIDVSMAAMRCPTRAMVRFCLGSTCDGSELKPGQEPKRIHASLTMQRKASFMRAEKE